MMNRRSNTAGGEGGTAKNDKSIAFDDILKVIKLGTEEFKELLTQGLFSNINMRNERGESLLMIQCINNCLNGVMLLPEHGADVNITDGQGNSALILACRHYNDNAKEECAEIIKLLAAKGANINASSNFSFSISECFRGTALIEACIRGRLEVISLLLELGAAINNPHQSPLIVACSWYKMDVVRLLIAHGADVNIIDSGGLISLGVACERGYDDLVKELLDRGADINVITGIYPKGKLFLDACARCRLSTVKLLLDRGADVIGSEETTPTPLIAACYKGSIDFARSLIEHGADVNLSREDGITPLMAAVINSCDLALIDLLLEYGADINAEDGGSSVLEYANSHTIHSIFMHLLACGADLFRADGVTLIPYSPHSHLAMNPSLINKYAAINRRSNREMKPLLK